MKIITNRQKIAKVLNFGKYPVLYVDLDKMERDYIKGSNCRIKWNYQDEELLLNCYLEVVNGRYQIGNEGSIVTSDYSVNDFINQIQWSNTPIIECGQVVAVAQFSKKKGTKIIELMRVADKKDIHSMIITYLEEINE